MTTARDVMTSNPVTCRENDPIRAAVQIMERRDTGVVPILDQNDRLCGVVTDRDICLDVVLRNLDPQGTPVANVMHRDLLTCSPDEDLNQVMDKMTGRQVKRILVTEGDRCVGVISEADIARRQGSQAVGELAQGVFS